MGWFYNPPPQPPQLVHAPAGVVPFGNSPPSPIGADQLLDDIRSAWPVEQWGAQTAGISAWFGATPNSGVTPPQRMIAAFMAALRQTWPQEDWPAQSIKGSGGITATAFVAQLPAPPLSSALLIRLQWPEPSWPSQTAGITATQFSAAPTLFAPFAPRALQVQTRASWPQEDWPAQSEPGVAAGLANVTPALPFSPVTTINLLRSTWPEPQWTTQYQRSQLAWIPPPVTAIPSPVPHFEAKSWPQESWPAQTGTRGAAAFATIPPAVPFQNVALLASVRLSWPAEAWSAQSAVLGAAMLSLFAPIPYDIRRQLRPAYLWPQADWPAQTQAPQAFAFPVFVPPVPYFPEYAAPAALWAQPSWSAQTAPPFASASSGPAPRKKGPRVRAVTSGTYGGVYYQPGDVFDLNFADELSDATVNYAGIGAGTQQFGWMLVVPSGTTLYSSEEQAGWIYPVIDPIPPRRFVY